MDELDVLKGNLIDVEMKLEEIPIEKLQRGRYQPRINIRDEEIKNLAESIESTGIMLHPITVRPISDSRYEIIAGERRWLAAQYLRRPKVLCNVGNFSDKKAALLSLSENASRKELNSIEKAKSLHRLMIEFRYREEDLGKEVGLVQSQVSNLLRLLKLDDRVQQFLLEEQLSEGHGKVLTGLTGEFSRYQYNLALSCVVKKWSVRKLEQERKLLESTKEADKKKGANPHSNKIYSENLARKLSDHLGHPTKIKDKSGKKGDIVISYNSYEHLEAILSRLGFKKDPW
jgi:ParB family chromosome partitioning protein